MSPIPPRRVGLCRAFVRLQLTRHSTEYQGGNEVPSFTITRHKRGEALRAVVEVLRQRTILSADGTLRCELEIVLQNQSEQFLKVALPYPKSRVKIFEVQVASRIVKTAFGLEGGKEVLLIPLIRTGLLEPELTVRIAYEVTGGKPLANEGSLEQKLPEILGGVPVSQSALVLMLPTTYQYSDFKGSLNRVELVDLEVDEALRSAKVIEKLSEAALFAKKGVAKAAALSKLGEYKSKVEGNLVMAKQQADASNRVAQRQAERSSVSGVLDAERRRSLEQAEVAHRNIAQNVQELSRTVENESAQVAQQQVARMPQQVLVPQQKQIAAVATPAPTPVPALQFPRIGEAYVFRQLQGTGEIAFKYASREASSARWDLVATLALLSMVVLSLVVGRGAVCDPQAGCGYPAGGLPPDGSCARCPRHCDTRDGRGFAGVPERRQTGRNSPGRTDTRSRPSPTREDRSS